MRNRFLDGSHHFVMLRHQSKRRRGELHFSHMRIWGSISIYKARKLHEIINFRGFKKKGSREIILKKKVVLTSISGKTKSGHPEIITCNPCPKNRKYKIGARQQKLGSKAGKSISTPKTPGCLER